MLIPVAPDTFQLIVDDAPAVMLDGAALNELIAGSLLLT
jgi:hypothetical protein